MSHASRWTVLILLACWPARPALGQELMDFRDPGFAHAVASQRVEVLDASRRQAAVRFLAVAEQVVSDPRGPGGHRTELLAEAQHLADTIAALDEELAEAASAAAEARRGLILTLETRAASLRQAADGADPRERASLEARSCELDAEVGELRALGDPTEIAHPLSAAAHTLSALAGVVAEERARLRTRQVLQDELRIFMGGLRIFDETGMPPSARSEGGGDPGSGCDVTCPVDPALSPADLPMEHFRPEGGRAVEGERVMSVTVASLVRLQEQILLHADARERASGDPAPAEGVVTREAAVGIGLMSFRGPGEGRSGLSSRVGASMTFTRAIGASMQLTVEPRAGARSVQLDAGSSEEAAGEMRETLTGTLDGGRISWQVTSWQKGRFLSDPLPPPAYLEPGRREGGLAGRIAVPLHTRWALEVGGGGDAVRYGPEDWRALDRQGLNAVVALARQDESRSGKLSLLVSRHGFPQDRDARREDTRVSMGVDGSVEGRMVLRVSAGLAWNDSRLPAYDYRSGRAALVLSAPWGRNSVQAYGALAHQSYLNPGPEDLRVAPSDQDTGSILAVQVNRPWGPSRALTLRAEWSRSVTGFANDFYQRFGTSVQVAFRGLGGR